MDRFRGGSNNLYGGSIITSFDHGHLPTIKRGNKSISVENKIKDDDNILMNSSIKKVMQKNRELHKMVTKLQSENDKLTKENAKYKSIIEKYKSR
jgi:predicted RNase H-like nuclease (RuvC/YqgF family)